MEVCLGALLAGIGATITPCILPLYPAFLAHLTNRTALAASVAGGGEMRSRAAASRRRPARCSCGREWSSLKIADALGRLVFFGIFGVGFGLPLFVLGTIGQAREPSWREPSCATSGRSNSCSGSR